MIPATITTKAPVGPPICTREPPSSEIRNPATTAVTSPWLGVAPLAMPSAMASGSATIATVSPARASRAPAARDFTLAPQGEELRGEALWRPSGWSHHGRSVIHWRTRQWRSPARESTMRAGCLAPARPHARGPRLGVVSRTAPHAHSPTARVSHENNEDHRRPNPVRGRAAGRIRRHRRARHRRRRRRRRRRARAPSR